MDQAMKDTAALSVQDRIRGCLLGGAIGDALGGPVEFWSYSDIHERCGDRGVRDFLPATYGSTRGVGLITDDTQMTLFTVEGIIRAVVRIKGRGIGSVHGPMQHAYQRWYTTQTFMAPPEVTDEQDPNFVDGWLGHQQWLYSRRAPGNTCMTALASLRGGSFGATAINDSKGCGTVMRSAPFGFMDTEDCGWIAVECSEITHGHQAASGSAGALAVLIKEISRGATLADAVGGAKRWTNEWASKRYSATEVADALQAAINAAAEGNPSAQVVASLGQGWIAEEALAITLYCALSYPEPDQVLDALSLAVSHSGDSDSTGAICGNILGALHGEQALPPELVEGVEGSSVIREIADDLTTLVESPEKIFTRRAGPDVHPSQEWRDRYPGW